MANNLILRDRRGYPWGKVTATIIWVSGGQSKVWVNESGIGEFNLSSGVIDKIIVAGETLYPLSSPKVNGSTQVMAKSDNNH
jgi:hypothetical protein